MEEHWTKEIPALIARLTDPDEKVRGQAIWRLEEIGMPALAALQQALGSGNRLIAEGAREAYEFILAQQEND